MKTNNVKFYRFILNYLYTDEKLSKYISKNFFTNYDANKLNISIPILKLHCVFTGLCQYQTFCLY